MLSNEQTLKILEHMLETLPNHWAKNSYAFDKDGGVESPEASSAYNWCLYGKMRHSYMVIMESLLDFDGNRDQETLEDILSSGIPVTWQKNLGNKLNRADQLVEYNDSITTKEEDVIAVITTAIDYISEEYNH